LVQNYESDTSNPKSTIFHNDGHVIPECRGVYSLSFLYTVARHVGADTTEAGNYFGRGRQAGALITAILEKIGRD
jgi:hypothetical protein